MNDHKASLLGKISSRSATVGVIGLGYVGLPLALVFEEAGFPVLGFTLTSDPASIESEAVALLAVADDPVALGELRTRCHAVYAEKFSREHTVGKWDAALRALVAA